MTRLRQGIFTMSGRGLLGLMTAAVLAPASHASDPPHPDARLLGAIKACGEPERRLLERAVATDSGTGDAAGLDAVGALYAGALQALGADVKPVSSAPPAVGDNRIATLTGTGKGRILLIAHLDTVFSTGEVSKHPPHWEGEHYVGPGAGDDKSGGVTAVCALSALKAIGYRDFGRIDVLLNASEETGSQGSRDLIGRMAADSDLVINLERGVPSDQVLVARKGAATLIFEVTGRAAHSGLEPEKGRNAALEAARLALALGALADPAKQTTVVVDILSSGDKINVVPARGLVKADVRAFSAAEFDRVEQAAAGLAAHPSLEGVSVVSRLERHFPPWPPAPGSEAVIARARQLYAELGRRLTETAVGSSSDANYAALTGTPTVDGFGMEGGGAHTPLDYADFATLTPRAYLLARLLMVVGHDPKSP